jgi:hypothetical protein
MDESNIAAIEKRFTVISPCQAGDFRCAVPIGQQRCARAARSPSPRKAVIFAIPSACETKAPPGAQRRGLPAQMRVF